MILNVAFPCYVYVALYCKSYKPQKISPKFQGTVRQLLHKKIRDMYINPQFISDVMRPMSMEAIMDNGVQELSGGELQRVAIVMCLGTPADIYLVRGVLIMMPGLTKCRYPFKTYSYLPKLYIVIIYIFI